MKGILDKYLNFIDIERYTLYIFSIHIHAATLKHCVKWALSNAQYQMDFFKTF